jgi:iron complex outermembrane receptor protein
VQELAVDRRLIFTSPQVNANKLNFVTLNGTYQATSALSFQTSAYVRDYRQDVANGNTTNYTACTDPSNAAFLCQADGSTLLTSTTGSLVPDLSAGGTVPIGENDRESLHTLSYGGALQATSTASLLGRGNQLSFGVAADHARIDYGSEAEVGVINSALVVQPSGFVVSTPEGTDFTATPVQLGAENTDFGAFITDTFDLTRRLSITASGRYNRVRIELQDRMGTSLSGTNTYSRFNPAIGATYQLGKELTAYAGYAEGSRAPTASEIECSDPQAPCLLPSSLSADPPNLKQVVSRTYELGLRGSRPLAHGRISFSLGLYRTEVHDDIYAVATSLSAGFFQNIAGTRRQDGELDVSYRDDRLTAYASFAHVDATFETDLTIPSPSNPLQDANGDISVRRGDHLPGIPSNRLKFGAEYALQPGLRVGGDLQVLSSQFYRGDEANLLAPLPGYAVLRCASAMT